MIAYPSLRMLIDGTWIAEGEAGEMAVIDPASAEPLGQCPKASPAQLDAALAGAARSFDAWSSATPFERYAVLRRAADLLRERAATIAAVITAEMGKPTVQAEGEVSASADVIDFLAEEAKRRGGRLVPVRGQHLIMQRVTHEPVGPAVLLTPWNFPVNLPAKKIAAALAAGCSAIFKPAENTPASGMLLVECFVDAGVPAGVLNLVYGDPGPVAEHLIASPAIRKVSFTGSTAVGKHLAALAARDLKRFTAELGGHSPVVIGQSVDLDRVIAACVAAKFRNAGQVCVSPTRFLVPRGSYDRFVSEFAARASALKVGDAAREGGIEMGPLAHPRRLAAMEALLAEAPGEVVTGGARLDRSGFFFAPTVIANPAADSRLMSEEPFGPIAGIMAYDSIEQAVRLANASRYGLASYAFSGDLDEAHYLAGALKAGMVAINHFAVSAPETPFGGIGDSGMGSESGEEGYLAYTETKLVTLAKAGG